MTDPAPLSSLAQSAVSVLSSWDPQDKRRLTQRSVAAWRRGDIAEIGIATPPSRPSRPTAPALRPPREVPRRRINSAPQGRIALLHALAHIELNAIDLAWDIIARFTHEDLPRAFYDDWLQVAEEEAKHYGLLAQRLSELGAAYGDLPAHDGLWEAAESTAGDLLARLAVVPLVLEARGLDVTPAMIDKLEKVKDPESAAILKVIYEEEIGHVAIGKRWFDYLAQRRGLASQSAWHNLVRQHFRGQLKPPFNESGRRAAGLTPGDYEPLAQA